MSTRSSRIPFHPRNTFFLPLDHDERSRAGLQDLPGVLPAPSSGCSSLAVEGLLPPAIVLGPEDLRERKEQRAVLRAQTEEFEKEWEAERVKKVEAGMAEMSMQVCNGWKTPHVTQKKDKSTNVF